MRIGIIALLHESNTFIDKPTTLHHFQQDLLYVGSNCHDWWDFQKKFLHTGHEVGGFLETLLACRAEAVPILIARAVPYGPIAATTFDTLMQMMFETLTRFEPFDGILVAPHGATVSEEYPDADGHWLTELRQRFGPERPIIGTLDLHANLSPRMVMATDALISYMTNPHLDQRVRGIQAAELMVSTVRRQIKPVQAAAFPPMAINIERQLTADFPCSNLMAAADEHLKQDKVLATSVLLGFPYADVTEMGSSFLVVTDNDRALARRLAKDLAQQAWDLRHEFVGHLLSVDAALDEALRLDGPVCLLDMGDNVGGGSPGDGTILVQALMDRGVAGAFACLCDPQAVNDALEPWRLGRTARLSIGGKSDDLHGAPVTGSFKVLCIHPGVFYDTKPHHGSFRNFDQGNSVVLQNDSGLTLLVTSKRVPPFSLEQLRSCGLDPASFRILVAKGVHAPVAAYRAVCRHFLRVNTPGCTTADMTQLPYQRRRRPMFPFEQDTEFSC